MNRYTRVFLMNRTETFDEELSLVVLLLFLLLLFLTVLESLKTKKSIPI